jgi:DNA-binding MurR/RpiR family transcriptional regulator
MKLLDETTIAFSGKLRYIKTSRGNLRRNAVEEDGKSLEDRIAAKRETLSRTHKRLARFVLDNKYFMSFASASQAADKIGASAATVVRFAQSLDYEGYSEMQAALRLELPSYLTAVKRIQTHLGSTPSTNNIPQNVFITEIRNIERTARNLSAERLDQALDAIILARHILVVGSGVTAGPAVFLAHSLNVIGFHALPIISGGLSLAADLAQLEQRDLLISIDLWRYVRSTMHAIRLAKKAGATTLAISDSTLSPLAVEADLALEVAAEGVAHSLSPVAIIALINVIIAELSYRVPDQVVDSLSRVDAAYQETGLLLPE